MTAAGQLTGDEGASAGRILCGAGEVRLAARLRDTISDKTDYRLKFCSFFLACGGRHSRTEIVDDQNASVGVAELLLKSGHGVVEGCRRRMGIFGVDPEKRQRERGLERPRRASQERHKSRLMPSRLEKRKERTEVHQEQNRKHQFQARRQFQNVQYPEECLRRGQLRIQHKMSARLQKHVGVRLRPVVTTEQPARRKLDEAGRAKDEGLRTAVKLIANEGGNVRGTVFGIRSEVTRRQPGLDNPHRVVNLCRVEYDLRGCGKSTRHT